MPIGSGPKKKIKMMIPSQSHDIHVSTIKHTHTHTQGIKESQYKLY